MLKEMSFYAYYPYLHASRYGRGIALQPVLASSKHDTKGYTDVTDVDSELIHHSVDIL